MASTMLHRLVHVARLFDQAVSHDEVVRTLAAIVEPSGVVLHAIGRPPISKPRSEDDIATVIRADAKPDLVTDWDAEIIRRGPSLPGRHAQASPAPFTGVELMRTLQPSGEDRWLFDLLRDHKVQDTLWCPYGSWLVIYLANRTLTRVVLSSEMRLALAAAGAMAVQRMKEIAAVNARGPRLTPRECTVLQHLSDGLTVREIAARLGVSEETVKTLVARAVKKLGARTQLHAVALALRERLI